VLRLFGRAELTDDDVRPVKGRVTNRTS